MSRPWYSFYPADYGRDTGHLTLVEHGAYRVLMDHYYATETPLPDDEQRLFRLTRVKTTPEKQAVRFVLKEFFRLEDDGWHHKRIDAEIEKSDRLSLIGQFAGKASAARRFTRAVPNADANAAPTPGSTEAATPGQPSQSPSQPPSQTDSLFEAFWSAYPRKEARGPAVRAWARALEQAQPEALIAAAKAYALRRVGQDPNFTRLPATWLGQECWLDDAPQIVDADAAMRAWDGQAAPPARIIVPSHICAP
jgi:uncharacterized protein YdaU (DUF1376 family)